jgi:hypothetical protein
LSRMSSRTASSVRKQSQVTASPRYSLEQQTTQKPTSSPSIHFIPSHAPCRCSVGQLGQVQAIRLGLDSIAVLKAFCAGRELVSRDWQAGQYGLTSCQMTPQRAICPTKFSTSWQCACSFVPYTRCVWSYLELHSLVASFHSVTGATPRSGTSYSPGRHFPLTALATEETFLEDIVLVLASLT